MSKISELNSIAVSGLVDTDAFVVVDSGSTETKKIEWGSLKIPPYIGAKLTNSVNSTGMNMTTATTINWDTENYDLGGWSAPTTHLFIVPSEFNDMYVDVAFNYEIQNVGSSWCNATIFQLDASDTNVSRYANLNPSDVLDSGLNWRRGQVVALGVFVNSGDKFYTTIQFGADTATDITTRTAFSIRLAGQ